MHKKGILVCGVAGTVIFLGTAFMDRNVSAEVNCGNPDAATGIITCTDSETGAVTYKYSSTASANASVTVSSACEFGRAETGGGSGEYTGILANNSDVKITGSTFAAQCNDPGGYAIYAIGYSNDSFGTTKLAFNGDIDSIYSIPTSGGDSSWGMSLAAATSGAPVIAEGFGDAANPHAIPATYTKIASYDNITLNTGGTALEAQKITVSYHAHASATQPAGTYTGAVKYTMVHPENTATPTPSIGDLIYLQDFAGLTGDFKTSVINSMATNTNYTLKDKRDGKNYTVAKLSDGKIWMTKNLDLAGGVVLTSSNTDFDASYTLPTTGGWTVNGSGLQLPASSASGFSDSNYAYVYNSGGVACGDNSPCYSYYSWDTATLGSGREITSANTDAQYSICPKGWRLPTSGSSSNGWKRGDFYALATAYGVDLENSFYEDSDTFYTNAGPGTVVPNFALNGQYYSGSFTNGGVSGSYWSSTSYSGSRAESLSFGTTTVSSASDYSRGGGFGVRCVAE